MLDWESSSEVATRSLSAEVNPSRDEVCLTRHNPVTVRDRVEISAGPVLVRVLGGGSNDAVVNSAGTLEGPPRTAGPVLVRKTSVQARAMRARRSAIRLGSALVTALALGAVLGTVISYRYLSPRSATATADTQKALASALAPGFVMPRTGNDDKGGHSVVPSLADGARSRELVVSQISRLAGTDQPKPITPTFKAVALEAPNSIVSDAGNAPVPDLPQQLFANATLEHTAPIRAPNGAAESADQVAWNSVSAKDENSLKNYLKDFPTGKYATQAQHLLTELTNVQSTDADAVLTALAKYSEAWSTKDVADITALRPGLAQRAVKQELASVKSIAMHIRPISSPKIEGDRAAVECIHEVDETFSDGVEKSRPGVHMTYALVRSGGNWLIQDSH